MLKIIPCTLQQATDFVNKYHRHHNASVGCKFCIAVADELEVHGVAICGRPVSRHFDDGFTLEILRVCTDGKKMPVLCCMVLVVVLQNLWGIVIYTHIHLFQRMVQVLKQVIFTMMVKLAALIGQESVIEGRTYRMK